MTSDSIEMRLREVADAASQCKLNSDATVQYDIMSDALIWSDELPNIPDVGFAKLSILRVLLRYRTTLLLGNPDESLKEFWDLGRSLFPSWPGYAPERSERHPELIRYFERHSNIPRQ